MAFHDDQRTLRQAGCTNHLHNYKAVERRYGQTKSTLHRFVTDRAFLVCFGDRYETCRGKNALGAKFR